MKRVSLLLLVLALLPLKAKALSTYDSSEILSYVAMPLAVSAVCDVRGVQTDRVGELVAYMDQANVAPSDFIDVFRYVPVALVLRTDNRPDFVEWVHGEVGRGVSGGALVTAMETRLRTYDDYVPVSTYRPRRHYTRESYAYAYEPDYVPVTIQRHCDLLLADPFSLVEMPVAVADVCDLGIPYQRVSSLVIELNLGRVRPVQFVELMRYAPAALVVDGDYYGQPDFVDFVRARRIGGISGYPLVMAVNQQLRYYDVAPQIDYAPPGYASQNDYMPQVTQNYVPPANAAYFPPDVRTRFATGRAAFNQPAPAIAAPQVQRLLSQNGPAVVTNPVDARRELGRRNRAEREARIATMQPPFGNPGNIENHGRGRAMGQQPVVSVRVIASSAHGNGRGHERNFVAAPAPPMISSGVVHERGRGHAGRTAIAAPAPMISSAPMHEHGNGRGRGQAPSMALPPPMISSAPAGPPAHGHRRGNDPVQVSAPMVSPAPVPATFSRDHGRGRATASPITVTPAVQAPVAQAPPPVMRQEHAMASPLLQEHQPPLPVSRRKERKGKTNEKTTHTLDHPDTHHHDWL